jgi:hypothetical protein
MRQPTCRWHARRSDAVRLALFRSRDALTKHLERASLVTIHPDAGRRPVHHEVLSIVLDELEAIAARPVEVCLEGVPERHRQGYRWVCLGRTNERIALEPRDSGAGADCARLHLGSVGSSWGIGPRGGVRARSRWCEVARARGYEPDFWLLETFPPLDRDRSRWPACVRGAAVAGLGLEQTMDKLGADAGGMGVGRIRFGARRDAPAESAGPSVGGPHAARSRSGMRGAKS